MTVSPSISQSPSVAQLAAQFPPTFLWGAATSSYQIEGAVNEDGRGRSIWDDFTMIPGKTHSDENGAVTIDHYHRYADDIALMARLGLKSYRFSIAWPRIFPDGTGAINEAGLAFYDRLIDTLLAHNIEPAITIYHWDLPSTLYLKGGWLNRATSYAFADYAEVVFKRYKDRVSIWQTLNEPWCSAFLGYGSGWHAPGHTNLAEALTASHYLLLGHGLALQRMRALASSKHKFGLTMLLSPVYSGNETPETARAVFQEDTFLNTWLCDPIFKGTYPAEIVRRLGGTLPIQTGDMATISSPIDFLGVNYYTRVLLRGVEQNGEVQAQRIQPVPEACYTSMGWEIYPQGLTDLLVRLHQEYAPNAIYITENGSSFEDTVSEDGKVHDPRRNEYLKLHLAACAEAIRKGVPVQGYYLWSIFDNFEWGEGYSKRFGIVYIDYKTQERIIKDSGYWYASLIESHHS
jgi:beta-glucosidase